MVADLRSDTITKPTPEMYEAMASAELGDDVLGDEPTVMKLEELAAERTGKEAGLFLPSGTMANQVALATHTSPGDSVLFEDEAHMVYYEAGALAVVAGVVCRSMPSTDGVVDPAEIERRMLSWSEHTPGTTLACFENTHNRHGGAATPVGHHAEYRRIADKHGMKIHLDGARVFNASVALGVDVKEITRHVDSVSFCLSKGLCSPVGSLLCGPAGFITKARFWRKRLGGGMRQAGILAACGIVSLTKMVDRLADDHAKAEKMRDAFMELPGLEPLACQTNILMVDTSAAADGWQERLEKKGVRCFAYAPNRLRFVTHHDVSDEAVGHAIDAVSGLAGELC
ncbi:MAG: aminotransferase class I/II-fold pyridoxal phosphate-dependent enzyme [Armatimonadetes bacterium]|nr:aminotransferase class I/II-fold pyridoxal phosphate-dependent enzyme [Armatimonadota bacterium]